jgi:DNA-binding NtrC family response regulator
MASFCAAVRFAWPPALMRRDRVRCLPGKSDSQRSGSEIVAPSPPPLTPQTDMPFKDAKELWVAAFEREYLVELLRKNRGNISHAAREAEIDRKYFRKLMRKYDIEGPRDEPADDDE